jgi:hypothetical protein
MSNEELSVSEAINEFYRMKGKYEEYVYSKYIQPLINDKSLSKKEKKQAYSKLPKPECINCKRNVGTIFSVEPDPTNEPFRIFTAKCGDLAQPCPLNIQIQYSIREQLDNAIDADLKKINKIKLDIIKEKNNLLFFINELMVTDEKSFENFNRLTDELKDETGIVGYYIEKNILLNDNPVKRDLLKKSIDEFGKEMLLPFKNLIAKFNESRDEQVVSEAVRFYKEEMMPKLKEILSLKYDTTMVEYDEVSKEYKLMQIPHSLQNNETYLQSDDKVISFVKGVKKVRRDTIKTKDLMTLSNKKTRKLRPKSSLNEIEFTVEDNEEANTQNQNQNSEYIDIYNKLPSNLKDELNKYPDWLNDFMDNCIQSRKNNKSCDFTAPKKLILPPIQTPDTQIYDFGYEPYNHEFNNLSNENKEMYFKLVKVDENGQADYTLFKNALTTLVSKRLGFEKIVM